MRLFTAIAIPEEVRNHVAAIQRDLRERLRDKITWVTPENFHITLKFLGEVPDERLPELRRSLSTIEVEPMTLFVDRLLRCPPRGPTRVLAAAIGGSVERVLMLYDRLQQVCALHGIEVDRRKFSPHVTIGRSRSGIHFMDHPVEAGPPFEATGFNLMASRLTPVGSIYEMV